MSPVESTDIDQASYNDSRVLIGESHLVTQITGNILFGAFHIIAIIICWNVLVALMTASFDKVLSNADKEWKYARTKFWLEYLQDGNKLPNPFNLLLPNIVTWTFLFDWCRLRLQQDYHSSVKALWNWQRCFYISHKYEAKDAEEYAILMNELTTRYLNYKQQQQVHGNLELAQFQDLRDEVVAIKYLLKKKKDRLNAGDDHFPFCQDTKSLIGLGPNQPLRIDYSTCFREQRRKNDKSNAAKSQLGSQNVNCKTQKSVRSNTKEVVVNTSEDIGRMSDHGMIQRQEQTEMTRGRRIRSTPPPDFVIIPEFNPSILHRTSPEPTPQARARPMTPPWRNIDLDLELIQLRN